MRKMTWTRLIWGVLAIGLLLPRAGTAQERTWTLHTPAGGWIGVTVDFTPSSIGQEVETLVVITEVVEGGPAAEAGIRVGDTITHMDGQPVSQKYFASLPTTLEPGDLVRITVDREGRSREILVEARERPESHIIVGPDAERMVVELEALSGNILKDLDSLRLSIAGLYLDRASGDVSVQILRTPRLSEEAGEIGFKFQLNEPFFDTLTVGPDVLFMAPEFAMPFQAMIVESQATSSLQEELAKLRKELTAVRRQELSRQRELAAAVQGPIEEALRKDEQIQELRALEAELVAQQKGLVARLREVSEQELQRQWTEVDERSQEAIYRAFRAQNMDMLEDARREQEAMRAQAQEYYETMRGQIRSPVIVGQNFVLGAKLEPLNPELAEYFFVDDGVFVVEVMEGTPASDAGLRGGDVIISVGGETVTSISELRFGLNAFEGPLRIRVIRKGDPVEIILRR